MNSETKKAYDTITKNTCLACKEVKITTLADADDSEVVQCTACKRTYIVWHITKQVTEG